MDAGCGAVQWILFVRAGADEKKVTGDIGGIAPCACSGGQIAVLFEKIYI
jgi:hypothetical protein